MFIKLNNGPSQPFTATTGLKQGCNFSPILFNLYGNNLPTVYNQSCDPVYLGNSPVHCLMWADDCVVMFTTQAGGAAEAHGQDCVSLCQFRPIC